MEDGEGIVVIFLREKTFHVAPEIPSREGIKCCFSHLGKFLNRTLIEIIDRLSKDLSRTTFCNMEGLGFFPLTDSVQKPAFPYMKQFKDRFFLHSKKERFNLERFYGLSL